MWRVCCASPRQWNYVITHLDQLRNIYCKKDALNVFLSTSALISSATESEVEQIKLILGLLSGFGIIADYVDGDDGISFRYKNQQIFQCLKHAGTLLELYTAVVARAQFKDDERIYQDVLTGVMIGWNTEPGEKEVTNEVDVVMMNGAVPVFISCKNGDLEKEELFKLYTVASNFGGPYARMALVASSLHELGPKGEHICLRAAELGIQVVDDVDNIEEADFGEILGNLPSGTQKRVAYTPQK